MPHVNVEVNVDIIDFDTEDLIDELEDRGYYVEESSFKPLSDEVLDMANRIRNRILFRESIPQEKYYELIELITGKVTP